MRQDRATDAISKLRVFLFLHGLASHFGPGHQIVGLSNALKERGHDAVVFIEQPVDKNNQYWEALCASQIQVYAPGCLLTAAERFSHLNELVWLFLAPVRLLVTWADMLIRGRSFERAWRGARGRFERLFPPTKFAEPCRWAMQRSLARAHKERGADLVHTLSGMGCIFDWAAREHVPLVHTEMAVPALDHGVDWWLDVRQHLASVDVMIAISQAVAEGVRTHWGYEGPIDLIPNMVPDTISKPPSRSKTAADFESSTDKPLIIGTAARLDPLKGHQHLLHAIPMVAANLPERRLEFWLAGDGPARSDLQREVMSMGIEEYVQFLGHQDFNQMAEFWNDIDLFVLPTLWEGLSVSILEAMAHGKAVIASRVGGVPEVVDDGVTGLLVPPADPEALAAAVHRLLDQSSERDAMGLAGQRKFQTTYHADVVMKSQLAAYKLAIDRHWSKND